MTTNTIRWGLLALLVLATVAFGGVWRWTGAVIVVGTGGLVLLWLLLAVRDGRLEFRATPLDLPLALFLGLVLLQLLIGYPFRLGQAGLGQRLLETAAAAPGSLPAIPGTLDYHATRWSLWYFLAYVACFYLALHALERREHVARLLAAIVTIAGLTGIYGLLEYLSGNQGILGWKVAGGGRARGTFVNPDHFGAFLTLALFGGIGLSMAWGTRLRRRRSSEGADENGEEDLRAPWTAASRSPQERLFQQVLLLFILGLIGTTMVFTLSRGAILSSLLAGGLLAALLAVHDALGRRRLLAVAAALVVAGLSLWIGLGPVLDRFAEVSVGWADRLVIYGQAIDIVRDFPVLGTGFNTFQSVFPRYQSPPLRPDSFYEYAHNDLLQLVTDAGLISLPILCWGLWGFFREVALVRVLGVLPPRPDLLAPALQGDPSPASPASKNGSPASTARRDPFNIGVALGGLGALAAILIHSLGDFSLRIPANGILLSLILAASLQAARTRFHGYGAEQLAPVRVISLAGRRGRLVLLVGVVVLGWLSWSVVAATVAEHRIASAADMLEAGKAEPATSERPWVASARRTGDALSVLESAVRLDPVNARGHLAIGSLSVGFAVRAWNTGLTSGGRLLLDPARRGDESRQMWAKSLDAFSRAAYLTPMSRGAWGEIGWAHGGLALVLRGEGAEAHERAGLQAFGRGMALRPGDPHPFYVQADYAFRWAQSRRGRLPSDRILGSEVYRAGARATQRLIELQPSFLPEALNRVLLFTTSFAALQEVIPPQAADFLFAARLLEAQGLPDLAHQALQAAVSLSPDEDRPIFYRQLAASFITRKNVPEALRLLEFVIGLDPQNTEARLLLADGFARLKDDSRALREYQAAVDVAKRTAGLVVRARSGNPHPGGADRTRLEAVEDLLRERGLAGPSSGRDRVAFALEALAGFQQQHGHPNLAIPLWEEALARSPDDPQLHLGYGESLDSVGAWIPAQGEFRRALQLAPRDVGMRLHLAGKYMQNGLAEQAMALWQEAIRIHPTYVEAHTRLAATLEKLGRRKEAELQYGQILRLEPGNQAARTALARLRARPSS